MRHVRTTKRRSVMTAFACHSPETMGRSSPAFLVLVVMALLLCLPSGASADDPRVSHWEVLMGSGGFVVGATSIGARPDSQDGYDGQPSYDVTGKKGTALLLRRVNGEDGWTGPTGWFYRDFESPIPPGGSKTWSNVYVWSQNYTPAGNTADFGFGAGQYFAPPGYRAEVVLDYVPSSLGYTGPTVWDFSIGLLDGAVLWLPVPTVTDPTDPTQVVRMHITVTAPVPEPSALAALGFGLLPIGGAVLRRRLRCPNPSQGTG